ncbi:hypothetical protein MPH_13046 [Macrophomina phaseolina MS6]|uniref:Uncharacterized protein n=1 Tax=Macrophomina phaseolina (strain MS6) TaxID=1126212 RepID=K2RI90_MACPH|nr:hypothetical protein MPH_13046 [Macrophomina phaseolina MS6]
MQTQLLQPRIWGWLKNGPLQIALKIPLSFATVSPKVAARVKELQALILGSADVGADADKPPDTAERARMSCLLALDALHQMYQSARAGVNGLGPVWVWTIMAPYDFRELILEEHPMALIILGHYAGIVRCYEDRWYLQGWSGRVWAALEQSLGEEWRAWLEWPKAVPEEDIVSNHPSDDAWFIIDPTE